MQRVDSLEKTDAGRDWGQEEKGTTEDEMAGCHHWLDGHESEWTLGVGDGQGGLACCDSWVAKSQTQLSNWTELNWIRVWWYLIVVLIFSSLLTHDIKPPFLCLVAIYISSLVRFLFRYFAHVGLFFLLLSFKSALDMLL